MKISLDDMRRDGALHAEFDELPEGELREDARLVSVHTAADASPEGRDARIRGYADAKIAGVCARCLESVEYGVRAEFDEIFSKDPADGYAAGEHEAELDEMVMHSIFMELPMRFLCSESCKGLCPKCGQNLNDGSCGCDQKPDEANPFYKLKGMFD